MILFTYDQNQVSAPCMPTIVKVRLPFRGKDWVKFLTRVFVLALACSGVMMSSAYSANTTLRGTLTIDFQQSIQANGVDIFDEDIPQTVEDLTFTIPNQNKLAGIKIPKKIDGVPFRGQEFTIELNPFSCILFEKEKFLAILRLTHKGSQGTVFPVGVSKGLFRCLHDNAALHVMSEGVGGMNPFLLNTEASIIGELAIWMSQILHSQVDDNGHSEQMMRKFYHIPDEQLLDNIRMRDIEYHFPFEEIGPDGRASYCSGVSGEILCNRGGSAVGMFSANMRLTFKK